MALILIWSQQIAIKKISANNSSKYTQLATEVEELELKELLGIALLQDLQANPATTYNAKLLNGDSFTNFLGQSVTHKGLRYVIAYLNYAKYIGESWVNDTYTGMVSKKREESDLLSEGSIRRLQDQARKQALTEWEVIKDYLNCSSINFPKWLCGNSKIPFTPKFIPVQKTGHRKEIFHFPVPRTNT
jgi:hypothetical protein